MAKFIDTQQYKNGLDPSNAYIGTVVLNQEGVDILCVNTVDPSFLQSLGNFFTDLSQFITSLLLLPIDLNTSPSTDGKTYLHIGGGAIFLPPEFCRDLPANIDSNVSGEHSGVFLVGNYYFSPYFNDFRDYNGYTQIQVFLPYFGYIDLEPNDVMGKRIHIILLVDFFTGQSSYVISVSDFGEGWQEARIIKQYSFQLGVQIPIGHTNKNDIYRNLLMSGLQVATTVATGFLLPPSSTSSTNTTTKTSGTVTTNKGGTQPTNTTYEKETNQSSSRTVNYDNTGSIISQVASTGITALGNMSLSGTGDRINGSMGSNALSKDVIIIFKRPISNINDTYRFQSLYGKPCGKVLRLGTLTGFTKVASVHLENFSTATDVELSRIEAILKMGVIF